MYISKVSIINYRNFKNAYFLFNKGINTIIGENGSGKTNLFRAIRLLLDDDLIKYAYKLEEADFSRGLPSWKGHWIIISLEFSELVPDEAIQSIFVHGAGNGNANGDPINRATYTLFFCPKDHIRLQLSELAPGDRDGMNAILDKLTIDDYKAHFTGKSTANFNDPEVYTELVGDFENVAFNFQIDSAKFGIGIPHQLSVSENISFTFIKALRDVVGDFASYRTNPLLSLLRNKSSEINEDEYKPITDTVRQLNESIEGLQDVQEIRRNIKETIKEAVGETYSPSSLSIKSSLPDDAEKLLQSLKLFIGEPDESYEGGIHELSLGGANLIFLTLKLLEFKYQQARETFANFLLVEEPEAHIHTHIQKTLFDRIEYGDTQIIYSTHSTFISEACNIKNMNILSKKANYAEVFQPHIGLGNNVETLQRYLDAIRSNVLFAKGVILVEGDAEAILIPVLVKKVIGVSLDELGISLINIGSTGFENLGQLFHNDRVRRNCSIITDKDTAICDVTEHEDDGDEVKKYKKKVAGSAKAGRERKVLLDAFVNGNQWLSACYAQYTFEVDFILNGNRTIIANVINDVYIDPETRELSRQELQSNDVSVFGKRILQMANYKGKGWFALCLAKYIDQTTIIPDYIIDAIFFAKATFTEETLSNILAFRGKVNAALTAAMPNIIAELQMDAITWPQLIEQIERLDANESIIGLLKKL